MYKSNLDLTYIMMSLYQSIADEMWNHGTDSMNTYTLMKKLTQKKKKKKIQIFENSKKGIETKHCYVSI